MSDAVAMIAALGEEAITATYLPFGGVPKTFKILVDKRPTPLQEGSPVPYGINQVDIYVPNDATNGVTTIQPRKDRVSFKRHLNDSQETTYTVMKIQDEDAGLVSADGGMYRLQVQS
jgi:hypothetical protein